MSVASLAFEYCLTGIWVYDAVLWLDVASLGKVFTVDALYMIHVDSAIAKKM